MPPARRRVGCDLHRAGPRAPPPPSVRARGRQPAETLLPAKPGACPDPASATAVDPHRGHKQATCAGTGHTGSPSRPDTSDEDLPILIEVDILDDRFLYPQQGAP